MTLFCRGRGPAALYRVFGNGRLVEFIGFANLDMDGVLGAVAETGAQPIAEIVGYQARLAIDNLNGAFRAGRNTETATVAFVLVDVNDISFHVKSPEADRVE
jgi:hypothetical protein